MVKRISFITYSLILFAHMTVGCSTDVANIPSLTFTPAPHVETSIVKTSTPPPSPTLTPIPDASATPEMSPSGTIAMVGAHRTHLSLRLLNLATGVIQDVTGMADSSFTWSPDGQWIAFAGGIPETQRLDIFIIKPDGTGLKRMTNSSHGEAGLSWSPNGKSIVYSYSSSTSTFPESDLALLDVDKAQTYLLTSTKGSEHRPTWSPDGRQIAYLFDQENSPNELWVMDFDAKSTERIFVDIPISARKIDWSPDGQWIAFISPSISDHCGDIYIVRPDGSNTTRLTKLTGCATVVTWSPDGRYLAFVGKDKPTSQGWRIYVMDVESRNIVPIIDEEELRIDDIDWSNISLSK